MNLTVSPALIEPTGERFVAMPYDTEVEIEHVHRYASVAPLCVGLRVLDAACGEGYGAAILASAGASHVVALDIDAATLEAARLKYAPHYSIDFVEADVAASGLPDAAFDVVVSFETLEHLTAQEAMLDDFKRVLRPDGALVISTPETVAYNAATGVPNPFHVRELTREAFVAALEARFRNVRIYGQRVVFGSLITPPTGDDGPLTAWRRRVDGKVSATDEGENAVYLVAVCSDGPTPALAHTLYEGGIPPNALSALIGGVAERDQRITALLAQQADHDTSGSAGAELQARITALEAELASRAAAHDIDRRRLALLEARAQNG